MHYEIVREIVNKVLSYSSNVAVKFTYCTDENRNIFYRFFIFSNYDCYTCDMIVSADEVTTVIGEVPFWVKMIMSGIENCKDEWVKVQKHVQNLIILQKEISHETR